MRFLPDITVYFVPNTRHFIALVSRLIQLWQVILVVGANPNKSTWCLPHHRASSYAQGYTGSNVRVEGTVRTVPVSIAYR
jgi:hypothetical protein